MATDRQAPLRQITASAVESDEPLRLPGERAEVELCAHVTLRVLDEDGLVSQVEELPHEAPWAARRVHRDEALVSQLLGLLLGEGDPAARPLALPLCGRSRSGSDEIQPRHQTDSQRQGDDTLLDTSAEAEMLLGVLHFTLHGMCCM